VIAFAIGAAILSILPSLYALLAAPPGAKYLGFQFNTDDHMVYSAWMRQAMDGHLLMDNRFAVDSQPGLTIHIYFFVLGLLAKLTGIPLAAAIGKMAFSALFVVLIHRLIQKTVTNVYTRKLALAIVVVGGGLGFLVWENFGRVFTTSGPFQSLFTAMGVPGLPNDVWQPEGFVLPSLLTNGLFMVSLCLIVFIFLSFLEAKNSWKPVLPGALAFAALMNIHSYDVLIIAFAMIAFLGMQITRRAISKEWVIRALVIASGAIPPALWFVHVLKQDAVFQARAATPTYSANFKVLLLGYALMIAMAALSPFQSRLKADKRVLTGAAIGAILILLLFATAPAPGFEGYAMGMPAWLLIYVATVACCCLLAQDRPAANLVVAWALTGLIAPYFPSLFERKLTMGLSVPWAILAAAGLSAVALNRERSKRNLITVLTILCVAGTSLRWFFREIELIKLNVSNTTVHPVYLTRDVQSILAYLNDHHASEQKTIVVAMPGVPQPVPDSQPVTFREPVLPDLNPILSGFAGVYTYAGHWSETPDYGNRRNESMAIFLDRTPQEERQAILEKIKPAYIVTPAPNTFPQIADLSGLGEVVVQGNQFQLIKVR